MIYKCTKIHWSLFLSRRFGNATQCLRPWGLKDRGLWLTLIIGPIFTADRAPEITRLHRICTAERFEVYKCIHTNTQQLFVKKAAKPFHFTRELIWSPLLYFKPVKIILNTICSALWCIVCKRLWTVCTICTIQLWNPFYYAKNHVVLRLNEKN